MAPKMKPIGGRKKKNDRQHSAFYETESSCLMMQFEGQNGESLNKLWGKWVTPKISFLVYIFVSTEVIFFSFSNILGRSI